MKYFIGILVTLALAAVTFVVGVRQKWWKNPFASGTDNGDGTQTCPDGSTIPITGTCPTATSPTDCDPNKKGYQKDGVYNPSKCGTPNAGTDEAPPSGRSILINVGDLEFAPFIDNQYREFDYSEQGKLFRKATLAPVYIAPLIHYVSSTLPGAPFYYWWYKNGHYTFIKTEAGIHYYKKSILPNEIRLKKQGASCYPDWYLSGSKYEFDKEELLKPQYVQGCVYKKQS